jgi:hypothetical protein
MVSLNLFADLPKIREAFDNKTLQLFHMKPTDKCRYDGPCAVGVCMDPDPRAWIPNNRITRLINQFYIKVPEDQVSDWANLQLLHDLGNIPNFANFLTELEAKYAPH